MIHADCSSCPAPPGACPECPIDLLCSGYVEGTGDFFESCGYTVDPDVRDAIEVLRDVGLITNLEIIDAAAAA